MLFSNTVFIKGVNITLQKRKYVFKYWPFLYSDVHVDVKSRDLP